MDRRYLPALAPHSLTTQVPDQRISTGQLPEWLDCEEPALVGTCDPPVIKWQVLGLPFSTAIFRSLPIGKDYSNTFISQMLSLDPYPKTLKSSCEGTIPLEWARRKAVRFGHFLITVKAPVGHLSFPNTSNLVRTNTPQPTRTKGCCPDRDIHFLYINSFVNFK